MDIEDKKEKKNQKNKGKLSFRIIARLKTFARRMRKKT